MTDHQLAAITQADLRTLVDTLRDCSMYIWPHAAQENSDKGVATRLLARVDNVLDAHDYDANDGEQFALKEPRDVDQFLDGRRGR